MDGADRLFSGSGETALRQNQMTGRGYALGERVDPLPVLRLGGKLITCDDCPALQLTILREENVAANCAYLLMQFLHNQEDPLAFLKD
jgi:hypothetical protein